MLKTKNINQQVPDIKPVTQQSDSAQQLYELEKEK